MLTAEGSIGNRSNGGSNLPPAHALPSFAPQGSSHKVDNSRKPSSLGLRLKEAVEEATQNQHQYHQQQQQRQMLNRANSPPLKSPSSFLRTSDALPRQTSQQLESAFKMQAMAHTNWTIFMGKRMKSNGEQVSQKRGSANGSDISKSGAKKLRTDGI